MQKVSISELRANLLEYLTKARNGERFAVTSKGRVMATLVAPVGQQEAARAELEALAKTAAIHDVVAPLEEPWEVAE